LGTTLTAGYLEDYTHISYYAEEGEGTLGAVLEDTLEAPGDLVAKTVTLIGELDAEYPQFTSATTGLELMAGMTMNLKENCILILVWCDTGAVWREIFRYDPNN